MKERFWALLADERKTIGNQYLQANRQRETWVKDFYSNRKFLAKWSKYEIEAYNKWQDINIPTKLHICKGAYIGTHAIILDSCNYIGKCARIGAGAVVTKDIPDYAVAVGIPAKVVKFINEKS